MRIAVKGIGVVGGFGCGVADLEAALKSGSSRMDGLTVPSAQGPLQLPAYRAATERLEEFVPKRALRRIDHYSKMGLLGAHLALQDAGMLGGDLSRLGVVIASGYGATATTFAFLDSIIGEGAAFLLLTPEAHAPGYCAIDAIETGSLYEGEFSFSGDALMVLGADGRRELGARYRQAVPKHSRVACYAPIYGSMPAAAAFDLACAALVLKNGSVYPIPGAAGCDMDGTAVALEAERVCAVKLVEANQYAAITLSRL